jgi:hypothetical protein
MSLSLYRVPDGPQEKGQSAPPCPSVYSPAPALGSLSSVALSSVQAARNLPQNSFQRANYCQFPITISSGFLNEATIPIWSGFLREAIGPGLCEAPHFLKTEWSMRTELSLSFVKRLEKTFLCFERLLRQLTLEKFASGTLGNLSNKSHSLRAFIIGQPLAAKRD